MKSKEKNNKNNKECNNIENYITNLDISLGNMEKIGVVFLIAGYANYIFAANLDILEALDENNTGQSPEEAFVFGQKLVLLGYILLFIVASKRLNEKEFRNTYNNENNNLNPYFSISYSYLLSVVANLIRFEAFVQLDNISKKEEEDKN
ncbi:hypothetical protein ABFP60_10825 [Clostridioides difficile]